MNKEDIEQTVYNISRELQTNFAIDELCALEQEIDRLNNVISELENKIYYLYNYAGLDTSNLKNELQELKEKE